MKFKPCSGLLEEEGLRGSAHQYGQHLMEQNCLERLEKKTQPSINPWREVHHFPLVQKINLK